MVVIGLDISSVVILISSDVSHRAAVDACMVPESRACEGRYTVREELGYQLTCCASGKIGSLDVQRPVGCVCPTGV